MALEGGEILPSSYISCLSDLTESQGSLYSRFRIRIKWSGPKICAILDDTINDICKEQNGEETWLTTEKSFKSVNSYYRKTTLECLPTAV